VAAKLGTLWDRTFTHAARRFSQPVGLNYRLAVTYPDEVRGVIGICGGVPKNWEDGNYGRASAALMHIARREDEIFPPAVTEKYATDCACARTTWSFTCSMAGTSSRLRRADRGAVD